MTENERLLKELEREIYINKPIIDENRHIDVSDITLYEARVLTALQNGNITKQSQLKAISKCLEEVKRAIDFHIQKENN